MSGHSGPSLRGASLRDCPLFSLVAPLGRTIRGPRGEMLGMLLRPSLSILEVIFFRTEYSVERVIVGKLINLLGCDGVKPFHLGEGLLFKG